MFIVEFKNGGSPCWLIDGNQGDPPRTVVKKNAKKYKTESAARAALTRAIKRTPTRNIETWEVEILPYAAD